MFVQTSNLTQGIYVHIPFCLQKCHYCDFATVLVDDGLDMDLYCDDLLTELQLKLLPDIPLSSVYFGGGTPSLFGPTRIAKILNAIRGCGYRFKENIEITYEINPGTLDSEDLQELLSMGVNRFSVGVQTFDDAILKRIGREHSAAQSRSTLQLLNETKTQFTADLILGLPEMTFDKFRKDVLELVSYKPDHLSIYLLTVPEMHFLNQEMPKEDELEDLMVLAEPFLKDLSYERYEISNYVLKTGQASQHNLLHWNDKSYWGIGLGAHSYIPNLGQWGTRFWNPRTYKNYALQLKKRTANKSALPPASQVEPLQLHESMTDFSFTHLRQMSGMPQIRLESKFPAPCVQLMTDKLQNLEKQGYIVKELESWKFTDFGKQFADQAFRELCFTRDEILKLNL